MVHAQAGEPAALIFCLLDTPYTPEWWEANHALHRQGARIVPDLMTVIEKGPSYAVAAAARILGGLGHRAQAAAPALLARLADSDERVRSDAAHALAQIKPALKYAVAEIIEQLEVEDSMAARRGLLRILRNVGPAASAAIPVVEPLIQDDYLFEDAVAALQSITRGELPSSQVLIERLRSPQTYVACAAARALSRSTASGDTVRSALVMAAQGSDWTLEEEARKTLRKLGHIKEKPVEDEPDR